MQFEDPALSSVTTLPISTVYSVLDLLWQSGEHWREIRFLFLPERRNILSILRHGRDGPLFRKQDVLW